MTQSGTITVQNQTNSFDVNYYVGGMVSGKPTYNLGSGTLNNPSSGTFQEQVAVSGYELYAVQFTPIASAPNYAEILNVVVTEDGDGTTVALNLDVE